MTYYVNRWLQFVDPPPQKFICSACDNVLRKPMLASCCQMHFCEECLQDDPYDMRTYCEVECPRCKKYNVDVKFDEQMWAMIGQLKVKCSFIGRGCLWVGELGSRKTHTDPLTGDCEYAEKIAGISVGKGLKTKTN